MNDQDRIRAIKEKAEKLLFQIPGVHGVGVGHKRTGGEYTDELSIKVYVTRKKPLSQIPSAELIPPEIDGVKTDVVESNPPKPLAEDTAKYRPARGGTCIKVQKETQLPSPTAGVQSITQIATQTGTIGCMARTTGNPSVIVGLTNHHVLAFDGNITIGQAVGQSSPTEYSICSKCCSEIIGVVMGGVNNQAVDVALIKLNRKLEFFRQVQDEPNNFLIKGTYSLQTSGIPTSPYHVKKRGERTRLTTGTIDSVSANFTDQTTHIVTHTNVIVIKPDAGDFADHGDSGSALVSNEGADAGKVVGLLFGGDPGASGNGFAFDIDVVKAQLSNINLPIEILTANALDDKQTVPDTAAQADAYMVAAAPLDGTVPFPAAEAPLLQKVGGELLQTKKGQEYFGLYQRHQAEVRALIDGNKRVATAWHRNGGPSLLNKALHVIKSPDEILPMEIEGRPLVECVSRLVRTFKKYGSAALARDIEEFGAALGRLGGRNYEQILADFRG
jgi:hypothetical protein